MKRSDLSKSVLERPGATSVSKISLGESVLHRSPWLLGSAPRDALLRPRGAMTQTSPISLVLGTVSRRV